MPNVLTDLAHDIYKAADIVGREVVGFIPSVTINSGTEAAAQGDTVRSYSTRKSTVNTSVTPSMTIPEGDDQTVDSQTVALDQIANVQIPWTGEDIKHVNNGFGFETIYGDQIAQAFRAITNNIESHVATVAKEGASRAVGTAGTTPFGSNHHVVNSARQILIDNGMPYQDGNLSLVMNTSAGTNFRNLANLYKVNEAGTESMLRQGVLQDISGVMMRESAQIVAHTKGTGTGYLINNGSGEAVDQTTLTLDTGSGTMIAGDVITHASDSANAYVVNTALSGGDVVIGAPGLRVAAADNDAVTIGNDYTPNILLHRSAVELAMRPLAEPNGGDAAVDRMIVQDPHSGLVYQISAYKGYKKAMFDITVLYKAKVWKSDAIATIMG
jgi:hypothetical protein